MIKRQAVFNDQNKQSKSKQKGKSKTIKKHGKFLKLHSQRLHKMKHKSLLLDGTRTHIPKKKKTLRQNCSKLTTSWNPIYQYRLHHAATSMQIVTTKAKG